MAFPPIAAMDLRQTSNQYMQGYEQQQQWQPAFPQSLEVPQQYMHQGYLLATPFDAQNTYATSLAPQDYPLKPIPGPYEHQDVEGGGYGGGGGEAPQPPPPVYNGVEVSYSNRTIMWGGVLVIFSLATFVESMIKFLQSGPTVLTDGGSLTAEQSSFPPIARLISTVAGITLSMAGIGLGVCAFLFDMHRPSLTAVVFALQAVLSTYVFSIEVFAVPIFNYERMTGPPYPRPNGWSKADYDAALAFGEIFCLFSYCSTTLGMICAASLELRRAQMRLDETLAGATRALRCASAAVWLFGLGCLVLGGQIHRREAGLSRLVETQYVYPPNFVAFPSILVMTGVFIILYATPGLVGTPPLAKIQAFLAVPMWMWMVVVHILTQVAHFPPSYAFLGGLLGIMSLANILAPAVYCSRVLFLRSA